MNVFTFKPQFEQLVLAGTKNLTIRKPRRDGRARAKAGERISLRVWSGRPYASKQREFAQATVRKVETFKLYRTPHEIIAVISGALLAIDQWNDFARRDGFGSFAQMAEFFEATHGLPFEGELVFWKDLQNVRKFPR